MLATLVLVAVVAAVLLTTGASEGRKGKTYRIVFDNAFGLVEGGELRIGGVRAGTTTGFELTQRQPRRVIVTAEITEPGFERLHADARCDVRQQSLIGEYFVDCELGRSPKPLPNDTVPVERTSSTIPPDLIQNVSRRPYRERFRLILSELGTGLAGRPQELNEVIRRAHPALRETSETFKILAEQNEVIAEYIERADQVSEAVEPRKEDVAKWAREAEDTASIQASRREELAEYWETLPRFLEELEPTMAQLGRTADRQTPMLRRLRSAAPSIENFLEELGPFSEASRGSLTQLGRTSRIGRQAFRESREEIDQLHELSEDAPHLGKPLRQFLQSIDDRERSYENDPSAGATAPPAPDKTAYKRGQGFTGMEALLNYIYYQTLGINAFDGISHFLRIGVLQTQACGPYIADPTPAQAKQCSSWLGPTQPGVLGQPDPTDEDEAREREQREKDFEPGERRKAGDPEATKPLPGERDPSKPQVVLPPVVEDLLERLPKETLEKLPELPTLPDLQKQLPEALPPELKQENSSPEQALDYLLSP